MGIRTIKAFGYDVTGEEYIITDIENSFNDEKFKKNYENFWERFNKKDKIFCGNVKSIYSIEVDHENKKVLVYEWEFTEWYSLKVGDRVKRELDTLNGTIISIIGEGVEYGYIVQWDGSEKTEIVMDRTLRKIKD